MSIPVADTRRRLLLFTSLIPTAAAVVSTCVTAPLYIATVNDILYSDTLLPTALHMLTLLLDTFFLFSCCAAVVFTAYAFHSDTKTRRGLLFITVAAICVKYALNFAVSVITSGLADPLSEILSTIAYVLINAGVIMIAYFVGLNASREHYRKASDLLRAGRYVAGFRYDERADVFPFKSFISLTNPLQKPLFVAAIVSACVSVLSRVYYDLLLGAPTSVPETLTMVFAYIGDILLAFIGYVTAYVACVCLFSSKRGIENTNITPES